MGLFTSFTFSAAAAAALRSRSFCSKWISSFAASALSLSNSPRCDSIRRKTLSSSLTSFALSGSFRHLQTQMSWRSRPPPNDLFMFRFDFVNPTQFTLSACDILPHSRDLIVQIAGRLQQFVGTSPILLHLQQRVESPFSFRGGERGRSL